MEIKERLMLKYALGGIVLSTSLHSAALSLGASSGQAIIGRPLDISVASAAPLADIESAGCLLAQVQYGDTVLPAGSVSLSVQATADGALIRVRSSVPVNEPVVSVVLNTGCAADRFSRKYTLLADLDPTLAPSPAVAAVPLVVLSPRAEAPATPAPAPAQALALALAPLPAAAAPSTPAASAPAPVPARPAADASPPRPAASAPPRPRPAPRPAPAPRPQADAPARKPAAPVAEKKVAAAAPAPKPAAPAPTAPAPVASGPRLKLDPVDLSPGRNPGLKLNTELQTSPAGSEADRKAASELWAALNTPPEKAAEDARRLAAMEADLKALREQQAGLQASMAALTAQLQAERDERAPKSLLYALAAALALAAAALAWLVAERRRQRTVVAPGEQPWWQSAQNTDAVASVPAAAPPGPAAPVAAPVAAVGAVPMADDTGLAALHVTEDTESSFAQLADDSPVSVEALLDLVQQVEFFESLQQQDDAAMVLEQFIEEHPAACEMPYLLLMQQAQALGQPERLAEFGARFQRAFGAPAPDASCYTPGLAGLDSQSKFMDVLTRFWPDEQVLGLLSNTLLAAPGTGLLEKHSLQAFEDALLLYSVAHTLQSDTDLRPQAPLAVAAAPLAAAATVTAAVAAPASGLDLDLSFATEHDIPAPAEAPVAAPSADSRDLPMLDFDLFAADDSKPPAKS
jgi:hypothetical protein